MKKKSNRNKTIDFSLEEGKEYLKNALYYSKDLSFNDMINKNIIGDTFSVLKAVDDNSIDLLIVDPPYNLRKNYHGNIFTEKDSKTYERYTEEWINLVKTKLKDSGTMYVCCDWKSSLLIGPILFRHFNVRNRITWQREKGRGSKNNWKNAMEDIWYVTKSDDFTFNLDMVKQRRKVIAPYKDEDGMAKDWKESGDDKYRDTHPSNFWDDISIPFWSMPENTGHPTQKPEKLIAKLILASSKPGDLVLDPFAGSLTTSVVAKKLKRRYIGIEQNELYAAWGEYRLSLAEKDSSIQGYEEGIFFDRNYKNK